MKKAIEHVIEVMRGEGKKITVSHFAFLKTRAIENSLLKYLIYASAEAVYNSFASQRSLKCKMKCWEELLIDCI